jgi:hypothetical protein
LVCANLSLFLSIYSLYLEAEEAQAQIEELRDKAYAERRVALQAHNDSEMSELIQQRDD